MGEPSKLQCDFDRVMSPAHQARWIVEAAWRDRDGLRADDADLRARFAPRFDRLRAMPVWREVEEVLRRYVRAAVPAPRRCERAYWACAAMPDSDEAVVLARLGVGPEDVCTITADDALTFSFRLGLSPLDLPRFAARAGLSVADLRTRPDGDIEVMLSVVGAAAALGLFDDEVVVRGMRRFNLDLARRGRCALADEHNYRLADALLSEADTAAAPPPASPLPPSAQARAPEESVQPEAPAVVPFDVALTFIDRIIEGERFDEAVAALVASPVRRRPAWEAAEVGARLERLLPRLTDSRMVAAAVLDLVTWRDELGDDAGVLGWFQRALDGVGPVVGPPSGQVMAVAGRAHRRTGHPARGIELLTRALERIARQGQHAPAEHLVELGRCYTALGDVEAAQDHLDEALRAATQSYPEALRLTVRCALAERHLAAGDLSAARATLEAASAFARVRGHRAVLPQLLAAFAWCEERLDATGAAIARYAEALALLDGDAPPALRRGVLAGLVRCHDRRGDTPEADAYLRRAEAMTEPAWPAAGPWPMDALIEATRGLDDPPP